MGTTRMKLNPVRTAWSLLPGMVIDKAKIEVDGKGDAWLVLTSAALPEAHEVNIIYERDESGAQYVKVIEVFSHPRAEPG